MNFRLAFRFLLREYRAGELRLLLLALLIAVASLSSVGFLSNRIQAGLERESHQMLGADLLLLSDHPWDQSFAKKAQEYRLQLAQTTTFPSMVTLASNGQNEVPRMQLADIKAVSAGYPLRGSLRMQSRAGEPDTKTQQLPAPGTAWVDDRLAAQLALSLGDSVLLGHRKLQVTALLTFEPDRGINFFSVAPRLLMHLDDVPSTGLIQQGSRVSYRLLLAGDSSALETFSQWATSRLQRGERLEDATNARPEVRAVLDRAQRFMGLTALLAVILAAVGIALAVRRYVQRHLDSFAIMRCLGATQSMLFRLVLLQFAFLGTVGATLGVLMGYLAHWVLHALLAELIGTPLPSPSLVPVLQGYVVGWVLLLSFALPPILQLKRVPALRVLRRELGEAELSTLGSALVGGFALLALLFWVAGEPRLGAWAALSCVLCLGIFTGLAWFLLGTCAAMARRLPLRQGVALSLRLGLLSLSRRRGAASLQVLALSIGFLALLLLTVTRNELLQAWQQSVPVDAPNRFVINIQPDQLKEVGEVLQKNALSATLQPMVRGRLSSVNQRPVSANDYSDERAKRLVEREFNLSWRADLPEGNVITAGRWFNTAEAGQALISVEEGLAKTLRLQLGDTIVFDIAGTPVAARIVSLRKLNWDSMRVNFFVVFPPGVIEQQPRSYITSFYLPAGQHAAVNRLVQQFPNLTVIDISAILQQMKNVIGQVTQAVEFLFFFTLAAGLVVLYAALLAVSDERQQELAILRALGARRSQLQWALAGEFAVIGGISGLLAALGALIIGQGLSHTLFDIVSTTHLWLLPVATLVGAVLVVLAGTFAIRGLLRLTPLDALRA